ncbi:MAG: hypothetical protein M1820_002100 [Bogoriella megaspora]|nr:MAG: hypothetical protein M1820_002100 [Bogoriella megaspora]
MPALTELFGASDEDWAKYLEVASFEGTSRNLRKRTARSVSDLKTDETVKKHAKTNDGPKNTKSTTGESVKRLFAPNENLASSGPDKSSTTLGLPKSGPTLRSATSAKRSQEVTRDVEAASNKQDATWDQQAGHSTRKQPPRAATVDYKSLAGQELVTKPKSGASVGAAHVPRPDPIGQPLVWADGRQALCETLPYYRAYQSGGYCSNGIAYAFMFDKESHPRDYMDSDVVIGRAGGGLSKDPDSEAMVMNKDQTETSQIKCVRNNIANFTPVALISGEANSHCPSKPLHPYSVLGWFKPTHIWAERLNGKIGYRYRFERLDPRSPSWWTPKGCQIEPGLGQLQSPYAKRCPRCASVWQQIYLQGWICLNPECVSFWCLATGTPPEEESLEYDVRFLRQSTPWPHTSEPQQLSPSLDLLHEAALMGPEYSQSGCHGFACPQCGRCSSREHWKKWVCGNRNCNFVCELPQAIIPASLLQDRYHPATTGYTISRDKASPLVTQSFEFAKDYRINHFDIPECGRVTHFLANMTVCEEKDGPDHMFKEMQEADIGLQRRLLGTASIKGGALMNSFALNFGMPYKFVAATASKSFENAPKAINDARSRLNWAARCTVSEDQKAFNELLVLGYLEDQSISYHDDGEFGLGPTIATLSLGAPATMKLRMKDKHYHGVSKNGKYVDRVPTAGCQNYEQRKAAQDQLQSIKDNSKYNETAKAIPKDLKLNPRGKAPDALTLRLNHGDIVIMHGARLQDIYEHAVYSEGKLRFALTCRYIDPESLKPEDKPAYEVS